jgi:hypothetical protein
MGENVPYTSKAKKNSFIKTNLRRLKLLKKNGGGGECKGLKTPPLKKIPLTSVKKK